MSAEKGSKSRRVRYLSFLNLGCRFGCWHWLSLPSEGFWLFWQHLWLCLQHQFFLNSPPEKKKRKEIHTKQAFVFVQWSGCSAMRTRAYKPRGSSRGGAHSTLPQQLPSGHGGATGAGSLIEEEAEGLAHKMLWQSTALGRCVELQCSAGQNSSEEDEDHITKELICLAKPKDHPPDSLKKVLSTYSLG